MSFGSVEHNQDSLDGQRSHGLPPDNDRFRRLFRFYLTLALSSERPVGREADDIGE
jgi:hypothetical protein